MTRKVPVNRPDLKRIASTELPIFRGTMPAGPSSPEENPMGAAIVIKHDEGTRAETEVRIQVTSLDAVHLQMYDGDRGIFMSLTPDEARRLARALEETAGAVERCA